MHAISYWEQAIKEKIDEKKLFHKLTKYYPPLASVTFTRDCNLRCKHCMYPVPSKKDKQKNNLARIQKSIQSIYDAGVRELLHVGRTLKVQHLEILKKFSDKGMRVSLIDNGSAVRLIPKIRKLNLRFQNIDISSDGNEIDHELQRGVGSWKMAMEGIKKLSTIANTISLTGTASTLNYNSITETLCRLKEEFPQIYTSQIATTIPARYQSHNICLNSEQTNKIFIDMLKLSKKFKQRLVIYNENDIESIIDRISSLGTLKRKYISLEWEINNNFIVSYFPKSLALIEEFAIDADGLHILPFSLDYHIEERPNVSSNLIFKDADMSYDYLAKKGRKSGQVAFDNEKKIFSKYFLNLK